MASKLVLTMTVLLSIVALMSSMPSAEAILGANTTIITADIICPLTSSVLGVVAPVVRIVNAPATIVCGVAPGVPVVLNLVTDATGRLLTVLNLSQTLAFNPSTCAIAVTVPTNICAVPIVGGILRLTLSVAGIVQIAGNYVAVVVPALLA